MDLLTTSCRRGDFFAHNDAGSLRDGRLVSGAVGVEQKMAAEFLGHRVAIMNSIENGWQP